MLRLFRGSSPAEILPFKAYQVSVETLADQTALTAVLAVAEVGLRYEKQICVQRPAEDSIKTAILELRRAIETAKNGRFND